MLWEHNSTIVVMLTKLREMGRVSKLLPPHDASIQTHYKRFDVTNLLLFFPRSPGKMPPVLASREVGQIPVLCSGSHGGVQHAPVYSEGVQSD